MRVNNINQSPTIKFTLQQQRDVLSPLYKILNSSSTVPDLPYEVHNKFENQIEIILKYPHPPKVLIFTMGMNNHSLYFLNFYFITFITLSFLFPTVCISFLSSLITCISFLFHFSPFFLFPHSILSIIFHELSLPFSI